MNIIKLYFLWGVGMIINVQELRMHPHTSQEFMVQSEFSHELLTNVRGHFSEPVKVSIKMENTGKAITGFGMVHTAINLVCSRCLSNIQYEVNAPISVIASNWPDDNTDATEACWLELQDNGDIDLSSAAEEAILFNLPLIPLCKDDCLGLCSGCGVELNTQKCRCEQQKIDPRWQKLKDLK